MWTCIVLCFFTIWIMFPFGKIDIDLKMIFSKHYVPISKYVTCSSFTDRKYPKNVKKYLKKGHKIVKNLNFEKTIENVSRYRPKVNIFKTLCSKNYVHEVNNSIKSSKIVKNGLQIVKNENFQKKFLFALSMS